MSAIPTSKSTHSYAAPSPSHENTVDNSKNTSQSTHGIDNFFTPPKATSSRTMQSSFEVNDSSTFGKKVKMNNSKEVSSSIDKFLSPTASKDTPSQCNATTSSPSKGAKDTHDTIRHECSPYKGTDNLERHRRHSPKRGTLDAFFSSPKRTKTDTSTLIRGPSSLDQMDYLHHAAFNEFVSDQSNRDSTEKSNQSQDLSTNSGTPDDHSLQPELGHTRVSEGIPSQRRSTTAAIETINNIPSRCVTLPPDFDPEVFAQLPSELQRELTAQFAADKPVTANNNKTKVLVGKADVAGQPKNHSYDPSNNSLSESHPGMKTSESQNATSSRCRASALIDQPSPQKKHDVESASQDIPPDIDPEVFAGLPLELQQELTDEWKRSIRVGQSSASRSVGQMKQKEVQKSKNILHYFKK